MITIALAMYILGETWSVPPQSPGSLQTWFDEASSGDTIFLSAGVYQAVASEYCEPLCGNCLEANTIVYATVGFHIAHKTLTIIGKDYNSTILVSNAGYGVLFEQSYGSVIENLTVTGGRRDPDGNATDAGIVIKNSRVRIKGCRIVDNDHRIDTVVVGIGGIFGREGGEVFIFDNIIQGNGWDGVALYRGACAVVADNVIQNGRGAGIGVTWDASAVLYRNYVSDYWKGIGAFGQSWVVCRNNVVSNNLGWGIIATGRAFIEVVNNVIYHNGNCGFAVWKETARGVFKNNIVANNGWRDEWVCPRVGVWLNTSIDNFPILNNDVWMNTAGNYEGVVDQTGMRGNLSADPLFVDTLSFRLDAGSPCIDTGDSLVIDRDGSRSDMGAGGGPAGFVH